jgi:hypothetical protein
MQVTNLKNIDMEREDILLMQLSVVTLEMQKDHDSNEPVNIFLMVVQSHA